MCGHLGFEQGEHVVHRSSKVVYRGQAASFLYLQPQKIESISISI